MNKSAKYRSKSMRVKRITSDHFVIAHANLDPEQLSKKRSTSNRKGERYGWPVHCTTIGGNAPPTFDGKTANLLLWAVTTRQQVESVPAQSLTHALGRAQLSTRHPSHYTGATSKCSRWRDPAQAELRTALLMCIRWVSPSSRLSCSSHIHCPAGHLLRTL